MSTKDSTAERILAAVIAVIERDGVGNATTRAISDEAGTNIASINYHFRSKTALIEQALEMSWNHALEHLNEYLDAEPWHPRRALQGIAEFFIRGALEFPNTVHSHLFGSGGRPLASTADSFADLKRRLSARLADVLEIPDNSVLQGRVEAYLAAVVLPPMLPEIFGLIREPESVKAYCTMLAGDLLTVLRPGKKGK